MKQLFAIVFLTLCSFALQGKETMESEATPQYLYKILSYRLWMATQNEKSVSLSGEDAAFIHLSREDQLDRILAKYWADAPQVVILKLDVSKVQGDLVYEANPGGSAKYYHLYNGFIPCSAILEVKILFRQPPETCQCRGLDIVMLGDPVLRKKARELTKEEILSPKIQSLIEEMKVTMRAAPGVGLAAPQVGHSIQLIVVEDMDHSHLTQEQLKERSRSPVPYHVIINPRLLVGKAEMAEFFEACLSVPGTIGVVPRAKSVRVECLNERAEPVVIEASGWYARILQHEYDHLQGTLCIDRTSLPTLCTLENYDKLWKKKSVLEAKNELAQRTD